MENSSKQMRWFNRWKEKFLATKVDYYKEEICNRNFDSFLGFTVVGAFISFCVLIMGLILSRISTYNEQFVVIFVYFILLHLFARYRLHKNKVHITFLFYLALTPLMIMGILMGTYLDSEIPSITIMVFLCILTLFVLDKPWRIILYITCIAIVYVICCYNAKKYELFLTDLIHLCAFYCLAVGVNFFTLNDRIDSVEHFIMYRNKSEKDLMTGVYNREAGLFRIKQLINNQVRGAFIFIDIDNFKNINDNFGHMYGDIIIKDVSEVIKKAFQEDDIVLRMGGDEFVVYSVDLVEKEHCKKNLEHLLRCLKNAEVGKLKGIPVSISVGCTINDKKMADFNYLYRDSDKCLYEAKKAGKSCFVISE